jgi:SAM-dependent methyltransferase
LGEAALERLRDAFGRCWSTEGDTGLSRSFDHLVRRCRELLHGEDVEGRTLLEVGAGRGFFALYTVVCRSAARVTALDEYGGHGAPESSRETLLRMREALGLEDRIEVVVSDFLEWEPQRRFDLVFFTNVLHHIAETRRPLSRDPEQWARARDALRRVRRTLAPGGRVVIQELSCRNYCLLPKYRRAMRNVRRETKQPASEWARALAAEGFAGVAVRYRYPLNLPERAVLRPLLANRLVSAVTDSSYVLTATAP